MSGSDRLDEWEGRRLEEWRDRWRVPALVVFRETRSTNDAARTLAEDGAPAGSLVMSDHQTAGRGRMQRTWADAPGRSLLMSFVLRPASGSGPASAVPGTAPLRVGLAIAAALNDAAGIQALLKWPNDVIVGGRKLAGILCEATTSGNESLIIAGIGINVLQGSHDWPADLKGSAISVTEAAPVTAPARPDLMEAVVHAMRPLFTRPLEPLTADELIAYADVDALRDRQVTVTGSLDTEGTAAGIAADGALLVLTAAGMRRVLSGTVRTARPLPYTTARKPQ